MPVLVLLAAGLLACGGDAARAPDAGRDAAIPDAARALDAAGTPDAAADDAAQGVDAGAPRCEPREGTAGDADRTVDVEGDERRFLLHVPAQYDPTAPMPLVVVFHGVTSSPEEIREVTHFDEVGDERGFMVAYPEGRNGSFNGGACCGLSRLLDVDDVGFTRALVDLVATEYCLDERRVYASGFSNGGFMTHRLGCEMADRLAAIAVVAGQEGVEICAPTRPMPVVQVHGTADPVVPYGGNSFIGFPSTQETIDGWAERDGCSDTSETLSTEGSVTCMGRTGCAEGSEVILCANEGGVHDWVGGGDLWTEQGPPPGFVTTLYFADFLARHALP